jgi:hypothetical protein
MASVCKLSCDACSAYFLDSPYEYLNLGPPGNKPAERRRREMADQELSEAEEESRRREEKEDGGEEEEEDDDECADNPGCRPLRVAMPAITFGTAGLGEGTTDAVVEALQAGYSAIDTAEVRAREGPGVYRCLEVRAAGDPLQGASGTQSRGGRAACTCGCWLWLPPQLLLLPSEPPANLCNHPPPKKAREWYRQDLIPPALQRANANRGEVFLISKIHPRHHGAAAAKDAVERIKRELGTKYVDLLLIHYPHCSPELGCSDQEAKVGRGRAWRLAAGGVGAAARPRVRARRGVGSGAAGDGPAGRAPHTASKLRKPHRRAPGGTLGTLWSSFTRRASPEP